MARNRPYALTIAGFDPSGGAGIVADCKTFEQLKVQGLSVLTANTVQTEDTFVSANWTIPELLLEQLSALLERYAVGHVKIGLVENASVLIAVLQLLRAKTENAFIAWDPILAPTAGGNLSEQRFTERLPEILPHIDLVTPNIPEYTALFGTKDPAGLATETGVSIYLKGGHAAAPGKDVLHTPEKSYPFRPHVTTDRSKHGTGCVLSAAIVAYRARRFPVVKGSMLAKRYLEKVLVSNETLLGYHAR